MAGRNLELALKIKALVEGLKNVEALANDVTRLHEEAGKPVPDPTPRLKKGAEDTANAVSNLTKELGGLISTAAIAGFVRQAVQEFVRVEAAFRGLESVANFTATGIGRSMEEARRLTKDGLMSPAEASKAIQNLLQYGFSIEQAGALLDRFKDSAAFNRAAHLGFGEAIVTATEGIKNENSVLVDNVGLTKNLSIIYEEYGRSIHKSADALTAHEKVQALMTLGMKEMEAQAGNAQKAAEGLQGSMARFSTEVKTFLASAGAALAPAVTQLAQWGTQFVNAVLMPLIAWVQIAGAQIGATFTNIGRIVDLVRTRDLTAFREATKRDRQILEEMIAEIKGKSKEGAQAAITPDEKGALAGARRLVEERKKLGELDAQLFRKMGEEIKKSDKEVADDRVKNQERIVEAVRAAWEKTRAEAAKALDDVQKARDKQSAIRQSTEDKIADIRQRGLSPEQKQALLPRQSDDAMLAAESALARAVVAASRGDLKGAERAREEAEKAAERAQKLGEQVEDPGAAERLVSESGAILDKIQDARAKAAEQQAADLEKQAEHQLEVLKPLEEQLQLLKRQAADIEIKVKADEARRVIAELEQRLAKLSGKPSDALFIEGTDKDKTLTPLFGKAGGGQIRGPGGPRDDKVLLWGSNGEFMQPASAVDYYGLAFMEAIRRRSLPRLAAGGPIGGAGSSSGGSGTHSGTPVHLHLPGGDTFTTMASRDTASGLQAALRRQALKTGIRR